MDAEQLAGEVRAWVENKSRELDNGAIEIEPETDLLGTGVLDSLAFIDLVGFIEEQTGQPVDLLDIDPEEFTTIRGLCDAALAGMSG
jgi:acyl carrier protein